MAFKNMREFLALVNKVDAINTDGGPILFNPFGTRERTAMTIGLHDWRAAKLNHSEVLADPAAVAAIATKMAGIV